MKRTMLALLSLCFVWTAMAQSGIYDITVKDAEGKEVLLKEYEGKTLLIVNTATGCGFTPQYEALEKLYEQYREQGFVVLDFPCNQKYGTKFPLFEKIEVNGENESPLYTYLKSQKGFEGFTGERADAMNAMLKKKDKDYASKPDIKWNFTKFLVDKQGNVVARFEPTAGMDEVEKAIRALL